MTHQSTSVEMLKAKLAGETHVAKHISSSSLLTVCLAPLFAVAVGSPVKTEAAKPYLLLL